MEIPCSKKSAKVWNLKFLDYVFWNATSKKTYSRVFGLKKRKKRILKLCSQLMTVTDCEQLEPCCYRHRRMSRRHLRMWTQLCLPQHHRRLLLHLPYGLQIGWQSQRLCAWQRLHLHRSTSSTRLWETDCADRLVYVSCSTSCLV